MVFLLSIIKYRRKTLTPHRIWEKMSTMSKIIILLHDKWNKSPTISSNSQNVGQRNPTVVSQVSSRVEKGHARHNNMCARRKRSSNNMMR